MATEVYRVYEFNQDPQQLFEKATAWLSDIELAPRNPDTDTIIAKQVQDAMIRAIFGSNMIERVGLGLDLTIDLCKAVLAGEQVDIPERDSDYQAKLVVTYRSKQPNLSKESAQYILRGRAEIVQHAKAFQFIIHTFVVERQDMTEKLLKDVHKILTKEIHILDNNGAVSVPSSEYGDKYRTVVVGAGETNFSVPKFVPQHMSEMCQSLKEDLEQAEKEQTIDPFALAAKYSLQFVQIHPFQDGNGRMCRMILNAILCRYAGIIIPIGEQGEERVEYMGVKKRASSQMEGHGEYATFVLRRAMTRAREMKKKLAGKLLTKRGKNK